MTAPASCRTLRAVVPAEGRTGVAAALECEKWLGVFWVWDTHARPVMRVHDASDSSDTGRLRRLQVLDQLLPALAGVLDIREVFNRVSDIAQQVLPHDLLALPMLGDDGETATAYAIARTGPESRHASRPAGPPTSYRIPPAHRHLLAGNWDYILHDDIQQDPIECESPPAKRGYRSLLRVAIHLHEKFVGSLDLLSLTPGLYKPEDALIGRRIADHIALALSHQKLAEEVERAAQARERSAALERRVKTLTAELESVGGHRRIVGNSKVWKDVLKQATQVAATETTVLLLGDSGTGKEVIARFIHRASAREDGPFVALNCAALPEQLLESELFGFERGAFTGAQQAKPGQIEQAAGGVLFLDEVAEMSPSAQAKFLRVLQEREFQRLGGTRTLKANIRVVAATNRNLRAAMEAGTFREDLYYRLHVFEIRLPPLRERKDDIVPLSEAFLEDIAKAFGRPPAGISREARDGLLAYCWPGNVRELRNMLERAAIICEGGLITGEHLTFVSSQANERESIARGDRQATPSAGADSTDLRVLERAAIERALNNARHNKSQAAKLLGLSRKQLYVRLRQHGLA